MSAMTKPFTKEEIEEIRGKAENDAGDCALAMKPGMTRESLRNGMALRGNVLPKDCIRLGYENEPHQFAWVPFNDDDFFQDCKDSGYKLILEGEWLVDRWAFGVPNRDWRWGTAKMLINRNEFLMYRPKDLYDRENELRQKRIEEEMGSLHGKNIQAGQELGLGVEGKFAGQEFAIPPPPQRTSVNVQGAPRG